MTKIIKNSIHFEIKDLVFGSNFVSSCPHYTKCSPFLSRNTRLKYTVQLKYKADTEFSTQTLIYYRHPLFAHFELKWRSA